MYVRCKYTVWQAKEDNEILVSLTLYTAYSLKKIYIVPSNACVRVYVWMFKRNERRRYFDVINLFCDLYVMYASQIEQKKCIHNATLQSIKYVVEVFSFHIKLLRFGSWCYSYF